MASVTGETFNDYGIDGGEPAYRTVGVEQGIHRLATVAFKVDGHGGGSRHAAIAATDCCQQQVVDVGIERGQAGSGESLCVGSGHADLST